MAPHLRRSLKVSWDPSGTSRDYTSEELRAVFTVHGLVEDVVLRERWDWWGGGRLGRMGQVGVPEEYPE